MNLNYSDVAESYTDYKKRLSSKLIKDIESDVSRYADNSLKTADKIEVLDYLRSYIDTACKYLTNAIKRENLIKNKSL